MGDSATKNAIAADCAPDCVEMECAALFMNAARAGKEALGILTISDHVFRDEAISAEARQTSFNRMMEIALGI